MTESIDQGEIIDGLMSDFLDESTQLIEILHNHLTELDESTRAIENPDFTVDEDVLNDMFRSAHSIKGLSAMLGLPRINGLTHSLENVLDAARRDEVSINVRVVEVMFDSVDKLSDLIDHLRRHQNEDLDCQPQINSISEILDNKGSTPMSEPQKELNEVLDPQPEIDVAQETAQDASGSLEQEKDEIRKSCQDLFSDAVDETQLPAKYLAIFLDETELSLDEIVDVFLQNEDQKSSNDTRNVMIAAHRIKGSAASLGLNRPAKLAHLMEDVLQRMIDTGRTISTTLADVLMNCADGLRGYLRGLRDGTETSDCFDELAIELLIAELTLVAEPAPETPAKDPEKDIEQDKGEPSGIDKQGLLAEANALFQEAGQCVYWAQIDFRPNTPLAGVKAQLVCEKINRLGSLVVALPSREELESISELQSIQCGFVGCDRAEEVRSSLSVSGVENIDLEACPIGADTWENCLSDSSELAPKVHSESPPAEPEPKCQEQPIKASEPAAPQTIEPAEEPTSPEPSPISVTPPTTEPVQSQAEPSQSVPSKSSAPTSRIDPTSKPAETLRVDIERLDQLMNLAGQLVISKARFNQLGENLRDAIPHKQCNQWMDVANNICSNLIRTSDCSENSSKDFGQMQVQLRRLQQRLDSIQTEINRVNDIRHGLTSFFDAVHQLDRVTEGIQQTVMETRMVPIGPLFNRFRRVVRDISRISNKEISLEVSGEKTELDKRMIDELSDPLIHMVRNSADHGVEGPDERRTAGKGPCGRITLNAFHRGNSIVIQVTDDGRGLDREKIAAKAVEKGLVTQFDLDRMSDQQIYQLIWEPGFSTAEKVTEISGRGMGMDIVRAKIEAINGVVEVDSKPGEGAVFTVKLPLTMAILPSLMAEVDQDLFSIPVESIVEIVRVRWDEIRTVHGKRTAVVRGRVVSIIELQETFTWNGAQQQGGNAVDATIVIIRNDSREVGLVVDSILGEEDVVVKSLAENYQNIEGIAGACVLGDGSVALILDPAAVIDMAVIRETQLA